MSHRPIAAALAVAVALAACGPDDPDVRATRSETTVSTTTTTTTEPPAPTTTESPATTEPAAPSTESPTTSALPRRSPDGIGDALFPDLGNPGVDVVDYDIAIRYEPDIDSVSATATLVVRSTDDLDVFTLDAIGLDVVSVTIDGTAADFEADSPELRIMPVDAIAADAEFAVEIAYEVAPDPQSSVIGLPNGWFHTEGVAGAGGSYVLNQPDGARTWLPSNDHPSDKATWTFRITVPDGLTGVANGALEGNESNGDGTTTWTWRQDEPMATYLVQLLTGDYEIVEGSGPDGLPLVSVVLRSDRATMEPYLSTIDDQIDFFDDLFGPYPLDRYGIAITDSFGGLAMETQGRSLFSREDFTGQVGYLQELLLSHELGHMWFGDAVSPARWTDIWMNESFATYAQWLWLDHVGQSSIEDEAGFALQGRQGGLGLPTGSPTASPTPEEMFGFNSYDGGATILHALRLTVGDDEFFELLRTWVAENRFESRTTDDFIALAAEVTGDDLDQFWDDWLYATDLPDAYPTPTV
jgi:aminopeptidase N